MAAFLYFLLAIIILLLMVVIHELGHYVSGKILKFKIDEFSVGFGPKLVQKKLKNGELISLRLFPLGGYCAFYGDDGQDDETAAPAADSTVKSLSPNGVAALQPQQKAEISFEQQPPWKRIIVLMSGAAFNFFSAIIFSFIFILIVGYGVPVVGKVYYNGTTPYTALRKGDRILAVDGKELSPNLSYNELVLGAEEGDRFVITVERGGKLLDVEVIAQNIQIDGAAPYVGFGFAAEYEAINNNFGDAIVYCVPYTFKLSWAILGSFGQILTGQVGITDLSGPLGTVSTIARYTMLDWRYILLFLPLIASNLAIFNLLPIPALDGMKSIFASAEWIRRKANNKKVENAVNMIGFATLLIAVVLIDVIGFFMRI